MLTLIWLERVNTGNPLVVDFCSAIIITHQVSFDGRGAENISDRHFALKAKLLRLTESNTEFEEIRADKG